MLELTILVNNQVRDGLVVEHGLAFWIRNAGRHILFDTGQGKALVPNAEALGIDLRLTDAVVLSHGHYDHTGGLHQVLERAPHAVVYGHPGITRHRFSIRPPVSKPIEMPAASLQALEQLPPGQWIRVTEPVSFARHLHLTGPIPRLTTFEDTGGPFFYDGEGTQADTIVDDQALWFQTPEGLVVVVGCCHSGLVNTLRQVLSLSQATRLHTVIGGFHLLTASPERLKQTFVALHTWQPQHLIPCHCTGESVMESFLHEFSGRTTIGTAGTTWHWDVSLTTIQASAPTQAQRKDEPL